jgi:eukaryotic-like serine/threonine-protein kinase
MEFQFGDWLVSPEANLVSNGDAKTQLEPRVMAVLRYLCRHPGAVIPAEEILQACWGSNELGDNPVHKAITQLRRAFGDSSTEPRYIETIRKRGYRAIAPVVTFAAPPATTWECGSPFRGLEAFQENHAAIFFGRVQATAQLRELVLTQAAHGCPMALVLGPSGSGKTSLVRAGLLPQLMAGAIRSDEPIGLSSTVYLDCADLGSGSLFQALAGALIDAEINGEPLFPGASADSLGQRLASDPGAVAAKLRERNCPKASVGVFVDRLEAVFRAQQDEADRFVEMIEVLAKSNCLLMLMACRNDFYPEVMAQPVLLALKTRGGHFDVLPPDGADIAQMVRQPALAAGLTFEKDETTGASLDDVLCDAARGNPDMLPLLQYALNELYRQRDEAGMLKFEVYRQLGGIEGAVGVRAEEVVSTLNRPEIEALPHVLSLLVNVGEDQSAVTSRRSPLGMLRDEGARQLVRVMVEARLFVSELAGDVPSFGVAHEALLRQWPRVVEWIERHRNALQQRTRISAQANRWLQASRSKDLLLPRGSQVSQAAELLTLQDFALPSLEQEFVRTSIHRARLAERVRFAVTVLIGILALLTGIFALRAQSARQESERSRSEAESLMTYMLGDFVEKLRPIGRLDLLDDVGNKALAYLGKADATDSSSVSLVNRVKALRLIAEVHSNRGKVTESLRALDTARELIKGGANSFSNQPEFLLEAAKHANTYGLIHHGNNELDKAESFYKESREYVDQVIKLKPDDTASWLEGAYAHTALGALAQRRSDYPTAAQEFAQTVALQRRAHSKKPDDKKIAAELATAISWQAESQLKLGKLSTAMDLYREEEKILRSVNGGNANWTGKLALSLMRQALLYVAFGDKASAARALTDAARTMEGLVAKDSSNVTWLSRLLQAQGRLAEVQLNAENAKQSYTQLQEICQKFAALAELDPKNTFLAYQSVKFELGKSAMLQMLGREREAIENTDAALIKLNSLRQKSPNDSILLSFLAEALISRADLSRKLINDAAAIPYCQQAKQILESAPGKENDFSLLAYDVRATLCLGETTNIAPKIARLNEMGYQEVKFTQYVSSHPLLKGKP